MNVYFQQVVGDGPESRTLVFRNPEFLATIFELLCIGGQVEIQRRALRDFVLLLTKVFFLFFLVCSILSVALLESSKSRYLFASATLANLAFGLFSFRTSTRNHPLRLTATRRRKRTN